MFKEFDGELPITTRILIGMTDVMTGYRMQILGGVAAFALSGTWLFSRPEGKRIMDRFVLTVPVLRAVAINANAARFSRTLAILLRAGLPLTEIMDMVVKTTDNGVLRRAMEDAAPADRWRGARPADGEGRLLPADAGADGRRRRGDGHARRQP
jgi:type II secretory pathway component PulF